MPEAFSIFRTPTNFVRTAITGNKLKRSVGRQRALLGGAALLLLTLAVPFTQAKGRKTEAWARAQMASAGQMREALERRPSAERNRHDYEKVIAAFRQVYFGAPASGSAAFGVANAAEVMADMGRRFDDENALKTAIRQYQFLRDEYPRSKYRVQALFAIAEIYKDDLNQPKQAEQAFHEFLQRYPHNNLASDSREALAEISNPSKPKSEEDATVDEPVRDSGSQREQTASTTPADASEDVPGDAPAVRVTSVRYWSTPECTRISIDLDGGTKYESQRIANPDRVYFDLANATVAAALLGKKYDVNDGFLKQIRIAQYQPKQARIVLDVDSLSDYTSYLLINPPRLVIDVHEPQSVQTARLAGASLKNTAASRASVLPPQAAAPVKVASAVPSAGPKKIIVEADDDAEDSPDALPEPPAASRKNTIAASAKAGDASGSRRSKTGGQAISESSAREAKPTASGDRSLIRALGLKIGKIVIDPGHGGHDTGTIGPNGLQEKDLVLDVSRRLGRLLESRLGADVSFTRNDDTFIPLESRTSIANQEQADLFVSVHANSSRDPSARGVETYYLNFTSSSDALEVAARENAVSDKSIHELQDLVKTIALKEKIEESREFASDVQRSLHSGLAVKNAGLRDRGVKKAPFIVLIGANMPSILAEISFVSNPGDERRLRTPEYRQKIAESLYRGIAKYVGGLSGVKVASKVERGVAP